MEILQDLHNSKADLEITGFPRMLHKITKFELKEKLSADFAKTIKFLILIQIK